MPRAEPGSTKHLSNKMKSKGLQRLRWYCQACSRQMRDENGFKCHVASESHVRQMMLIGQDPRAAINDYSDRFLSDFVKLLRTGHGEKKINVNRFYQEYIANKEHVHMNATRWASLTEFAKHLGREGICRVEEEEEKEGEADERGRGAALMISWIDNSPEALRRQGALRRKERQDRGDEEREWRGIREQIAKARVEKQGDEAVDGQEDGADHDNYNDPSTSRTLQRKEGEKITLTLKPASEAEKRKREKPLSPPLTEPVDSSSGADDDVVNNNVNTNNTPSPHLDITTTATETQSLKISTLAQPTPRPPPLKTSSTTTLPKKRINPLAVTKKPATTASKPASTTTTTRPMTQAERIMRNEIEQRERRQQRQQQLNGDRVRRKGDDENVVKRRRIV